MYMYIYIYNVYIYIYMCILYMQVQSCYCACMCTFLHSCNEPATGSIYILMSSYCFQVGCSIRWVPHVAVNSRSAAWIGVTTNGLPKNSEPHVGHARITGQKTSQDMSLECMERPLQIW